MTTALVHAYTSVAIAKSRQGIRDTIDDILLPAVITAVSRQIDDYCQRRFYAVTETRLYSAPGPPYPFYTVAGPTFFTAPRPTRMLIDDLLSVTSLKTDEDGDRSYEITWSATDYDLYPPNAAADARPYWQLRCAPLGLYRFPYTELGVQLIGSFGYSATTPATISEACLAQMALMLRGQDVALAEMGGHLAGGVSYGVGLHPFVKRLLDPYVRVAVG